MKKVIFQILNELGVPCDLKGRDFIETAIELVLNNGKMSTTTEVYPEIAKKYNTTPSRTERAIRHAIEYACLNGQNEAFEKTFGNTISFKKGKLENSRFIYGIVKYIKIFYAEEISNGK